MKRSLATDDIKKMMQDFYNKIEYQYNQKSLCNGIPTGFFDLDTLTGGIHPSELTIIAGRHSMGKTSFAINILANLITNKIPVLFVSYEMKRDFIATRMLSSFAEIDNVLLRTGHLRNQEWEKLASTMEEMLQIAESECLQIISGCTLTWQELFDEIRYFSSNNPNGVVIVDYFQLIKLIGNEDRIVELSILAGSIKRLAIELDIPIVLLSQVTKKLREQQNKHPNLEDLAECDALAQHADNVVFIYRDSYYEPSKDLEDDSTRKNTAEIIIAKQKNGPTGTINLLYQDNICKFKNVIKVDAF